MSNKDAIAVEKIIDQAAKLWKPTWDTPAARAILIAIAGQEAAFVHRAQVLKGGGKGPARGLWQFESGGGVAGVLAHNASRTAAQQICRTRGVDPNKRIDVWRALETDDVLACSFARLLLLTDPRALPQPALKNAQEAWNVYQRNWRPGKPHPSKWDGYWNIAVNTVNS